MSRILPILFNSDMVRAILEDRKTVTRRIVDVRTVEQFAADQDGESAIAYVDPDTGETCSPEQICRYQPGDILYVRETFCFCPCWDCGLRMEDGECAEKGVYEKVYNAKRAEWGCWCYRASCDAGEHPSVDTWHPSIHMPKEIARIWLKVTDVRAERLKEIDILGCQREGIDTSRGEGFKRFSELWDSTIKKTEIDRYGWRANPWVWVIGFERCEKPEPCVMKGIEPAEDKRPCIGYGDAWADEPCEMCKGCTSHSGNMESEAL